MSLAGTFRFNDLMIFSTFFLSLQYVEKQDTFYNYNAFLNRNSYKDKLERFSGLAVLGYPLITYTVLPAGVP